MSQKAQLPEYLFDWGKDKGKIFKSYCDNMFIRTQSMFVYKGLPDSIPVMWLEQYLQKAGSCIIAEHEGTLYALLGNVSGERDAYYQPTQYIVANPWLKLSKTFDIGKDCVYCRNDYDAIGLTPLISRYCSLMTENFLTVRVSDINLRIMKLLSATDDDTFLSTKEYLKKVEDGELWVVADDAFFDGVKLQGDGAGHSDFLVQFIEMQQYIKGSLYNELGINANFNMKRESINGEEAALNDDALMPLIDDMLKQRRKMCDEINEMFGLDVSVDYGSSWHSNVVEKMAVGDEELGATEGEANAIGGDEQVLPDDKDPQGPEDGSDVSRLNDEVLPENGEADSEDNGTDADAGTEQNDNVDGLDEDREPENKEDDPADDDRSDERPDDKPDADDIEGVEKNEDKETDDSRESEESDDNSKTDGETEDKSGSEDGSESESEDEVSDDKGEEPSGDAEDEGKDGEESGDVSRLNDEEDKKKEEDDGKDA